MKYLSTRGSPARLSFEQAVLKGLAQDGGLFIPASLPRLPADWASAWPALSFQALALEIFSLFVDADEIPRSDLKSLIDASYASFRHDDIVPLRALRKNQHILELFHGPTFAFKDVALQFLGNLFEYFLKRKNGDKPAAERQRLTVVGATSGDTGSAAIYGLRNKQDISIFILHPKGRVSPIQEAQMTTITDPNVFNVAVKGTFDDCQSIVKALFSDEAFNAQHSLGAINSINWARILAQITYYFYSYFAILKSQGLSVKQAEADGLHVQYCVPTGNFGDILAGWYARRLGLPMAKLVVATNENDILARFWQTGHYALGSTHPHADETSQTEKVEGSSDGQQAEKELVKATLAPAMDILVSSNFERLLWYYAFEHLTSTATIDEWGDGDVDGGAAKRAQRAGETIKQWMVDLKAKGSVVVGTSVHEAASREFAAQRVSDKEILQTILEVYQETGYVVDPHTAIGVAAASREAPNNSSRTLQVILATAHPAKFSEAVEQALSSQPDFDFATQVLPDEFRGLTEKERKVVDVDGIEVEKTKAVINDALKGLYGSAETKGEGPAV